MIKQNLLSGAGPLGTYQSSQMVVLKFFTKEEDVKCTKDQRSCVPYLHNLLQAKLQHSYDSCRRPNLIWHSKRKKTHTQTIIEDDSATGESSDHVHLIEDDNGIEAKQVEGVG